MSYWKAFETKFPSIPLLKLEGGSIFSGGKAEAPIANPWMLSGTHGSGLDAVNVSAWDLPVWQEMVLLAQAGQVPKEHLELPLVSANLRPKMPGFPEVRPHILRDFDLPAEGGRRRFRVAVTGILSDPDERLSRADFAIEDPTAAVRRFVQETEGAADFRVVMTEQNIGRAMSMALGVPGIDVILVAHNYEPMEPQTIGKTLLLVPVNEGRMITELRLSVGAAGVRPEARARFVPLDRGVPDDPALGELVRKAQESVDAFLGPDKHRGHVH